MTNTKLEAAARRRSRRTFEDEIVSINTDARPLALQVALLVPILAGLLGLFNSFRMVRLPDGRRPRPRRPRGLLAGAIRLPP